MADASPTQHPGLIAVPWLSIDRKDARQIIFVAQGAFNKLYLVQAAGQDDLILRVSLPVDPRFKTPSEVATLEWMSRNTELPVPKVMLHDASRHSRISFEWILMSKLPGEVWATGWEDVPRGPFKTTRDWTQVRLMLSSRESHGKIAKYSAQSEMGSDDEDDLHDAQQTLDIIKKLQPLVDVVFPPAQDPEPEATMLFHDDLSLHNILVDRDGNLTGVVDWEKTFLEEMASLEPGWMEVFESSAQKRDPDMAVRKCDNDFLAKRIQGWVDDVTKGRVDGPGLLERIYDD
ncbi:Pyruvate dehydrogenase complex dihydrolipoamide acetyltransferase [Verticillium dahliae VDG2]|nr:Pyruvate dehydrogenase complex dihydrolipoamide acetyltransferase [Verticillium dahliae VDG2]